MAEAVQTIQDALVRALRRALRGRRRVCPGSTNWPVFRAPRVPALYRARCSAGSAAAAVRLRVERAVEERSAAGRHSHRAGKRPARANRRSAAGDAVAARGAGVPGVPRQWPARAANFALRGKPFPNDHLDLFFNATVDAAHRARHVPARGRSGRARLLPDQRHPRSCARHRRPAGAAGKGGAGGRHGVGWPAERGRAVAAAVAVDHRA